jgi:hypothetical protein
MSKKAKRKNTKAKARKPRQEAQAADPIIAAISRHIAVFFPYVCQPHGTTDVQMRALGKKSNAEEKRLLKVYPTTRDGLDSLIEHYARCVEHDHEWLQDEIAVTVMKQLRDTVQALRREEAWEDSRTAPVVGSVGPGGVVTLHEPEGGK